MKGKKKKKDRDACRHLVDDLDCRLDKHLGERTQTEGLLPSSCPVVMSVFINDWCGKASLLWVGATPESVVLGVASPLWLAPPLSRWPWVY